MTNAVAIAQYGSTSPNKNRIINGAMVISQRNGTSSVTPANNDYTIDRFIFKASQASKFTAQQLSASPPTGFNTYLGMTVASAVTIGSGDYFSIGQRIEGYNIQDLGLGTSNAKAFTLSFWAYSSLTGTFGGAITSGGGDASYGFNYTISSSNTWTYITVSVPATSTGTWNANSNSTGMQIYWGLGVGSTYSATAGSWGSTNAFGATGSLSVVATGSATFYITGVQLEAGTTASPFEYRQFGQELYLCQRYYEKSYNLDVVAGTATYAGFELVGGTTDAGNNASLCIRFKVPKRVAPTLNFYNAGSGASGTWQYERSGAGGSPTVNIDQNGMNSASVYGAAGASYVACRFYGQWTGSAEL